MKTVSFGAFSTSSNRHFEQITEKYGIGIVYQIDEDFLSNLENPLVPAGPKKGSKVESIRHRVLLRYPQIIEKSFKKYPPHVIRSHLNAIFFAGEIDQHGFKAGGSYDPFRKIIYIIDNGWQRKDTPEKTIHHELSSLFIRSLSFYINPWIAYNPEGFRYRYEVSDDKLKTFKSSNLEGTMADYEMGFMNTYGQTNFENDFNEYSAMIFTHSQKFKKIMDKYPRVRGKFLVWLDFYRKIDPIFTEEYLFGNG